MNTTQNSKSDLIAYMDRMKNSKILVVGDIMLDRFVYGSVDRISPESTAPVLSVESEEIMLGGAGNVLANLTGLGIESHIVSVIGDDEEGQQICRLAGELGLDVSGLIVSDDRPTIVKSPCDLQ